MRQENVESRKARALSSGSEDSDKEEKSSIVIPLRDGDSSQIFCRSTVIQEVLFQIIFAFYIELDSIANCLARLFSWTFIWSSLFLVGPELSSLSTFNFFQDKPLFLFCIVFTKNMLSQSSALQEEEVVKKSIRQRKKLEQKKEVEDENSGFKGSQTCC